jgi:hypothetical protein
VRCVSAFQTFAGGWSLGPGCAAAAICAVYLPVGPSLSFQAEGSRDLEPGTCSPMTPVQLPVPTAPCMGLGRLESGPEPPGSFYSMQPDAIPPGDGAGKACDGHGHGASWPGEYAWLVPVSTARVRYHQTDSRVFRSLSALHCTLTRRKIWTNLKHRVGLKPD